MIKLTINDKDMMIKLTINDKDMMIKLTINDKDWQFLCQDVFEWISMHLEYSLASKCRFNMCGWLENKVYVSFGYLL